MKRTISRKRYKNHLEIIVRTDKKEKGEALERKIKRAVAKWSHSLDIKISYEILSVNDRNSRLVN